MSLEQIFETKIKKIILDAILTRNTEYFNYYTKYETQRPKEPQTIEELEHENNY